MRKKKKVVMELLPAVHEPPIQVISRISDSLLPGGESEGHDRSVVALRQGRHLLTTFHPELTSDSRFHEYFIQECVLSS
jgi:pyridoxal 5'-phosphate synthase pdxT subunit